MDNPNRNMIVSDTPLKQLALCESRENKDRLDSLLLGCFTLQKLYGREPESYIAINNLFHSLLATYPGEKVVRAIETWLATSQEFPTPADITSLIRRNGKPPLKESNIIAIRKKDGEDRTQQEWAMLREWEDQQQEGWQGYPDPQKDAATLQENIRLRQEIGQMKQEIARLAPMLQETRVAKGLEKPHPTETEKIARTIAAMKEAGAPQEDIDAFSSQYA